MQDLASRNHRRTIDLLKSIEQTHQLVEGEEFVGAVRYKVGMIREITCLILLTVF